MDTKYKHNRIFVRLILKTLNLIDKWKAQTKWCWMMSPTIFSFLGKQGHEYFHFWVVTCEN